MVAKYITGYKGGNFKLFIAAKHDGTHSSIE